jgi:hypothetical protein
MTLRDQLSDIAVKYSMEYVHETYLMRYTRDVIREAIAELELNGYDDAAAQLRIKWKELLDDPH